MLTGNVDELLWTLAIAVFYLAIVRLLDLNEREPVWSLALLFSLGGAAGTLLRLTIDSSLLDLTFLPSAALKETAKFAAIVIGFGALSAIGRVRGWSEVTDVTDGVVYGMATGLGFVCGETLALWLTFGSTMDMLGLVTPFEFASRAAITGLAHGVFGAIIGTGFGAAIDARSRLARFGLVAVALFAAIGADAAHQTLAYGNALGGSTAAVRGWIALVLPVIVVATMAIYGLLSGRRAIRQHLPDETLTGIVSEADLAMLMSIPKRQLAYLTAVTTGRFRHLNGLATLHNRQVMLALAKRREARAPNRELAHRQIETLRLKVQEARNRLQAGVRPSGSTDRDGSKEAQ